MALSVEQLQSSGPEHQNLESTESNDQPLLATWYHLVLCSLSIHVIHLKYMMY